MFPLYLCILKGDTQLCSPFFVKAAGALRRQPDQILHNK